MTNKRGKFECSTYRLERNWVEPSFDWQLIEIEKVVFVEVIGDSRGDKVRSMGYEFGILEWKVQVDAGKCPAQWLIPKVVSLDQTFLTNDPEQRSDVSYYLVSDLSDLEEQIIKISTEGQKEREKINKQVLLFFEERKKNYHLISLNSLKQNALLLHFCWFNQGSFI